MEFEQPELEAELEEATKVIEEVIIEKDTSDKQKELEGHIGYDASFLDRIIEDAETKGIEINFSRPEIREKFQKRITMDLERGSIGSVEKKIRIALDKGVEIDLDTPEIKDACKKGIVSLTESGFFGILKALVDLMDDYGIELPKKE